MKTDKLNTLHSTYIYVGILIHNLKLKMKKQNKQSNHCEYIENWSWNRKTNEGNKV